MADELPLEGRPLFYADHITSMPTIPVDPNGGANTLRSEGTEPLQVATRDQL